MKIYPEQLAQQLQKKLAPIYLISGDEPLLVQEACDSVRQQALANGFDERLVFDADKGFDWQQLLAAVETQSLFAAKKLIELRMPTGKPGDKGTKILKEYCANITADDLLLIITNKLDANSQKSSWFKTVDKQAVFVPIWPPTGQRLTQWIKQRLQRDGLNANSDAIRLLADFSEGNLLAVAQEIEKLKLLHNTGVIDNQMVMTAISDNSRYTVFDLVDAILLTNPTRSLRILHNLRQEKAEPTVIIWAISRELRTLSAMLKAKQQSSIPQILQQYRIWEKRKPIVQNALAKMQSQTVNYALKQCAQIDQLIKGVRSGNIWDEFERLILQLTGALSWQID